MKLVEEIKDKENANLKSVNKYYPDGFNESQL